MGILTRRLAYERLIKRARPLPSLSTKLHTTFVVVRPLPNGCTAEVGRRLANLASGWMRFAAKDCFSRIYERHQGCSAAAPADAQASGVLRPAETVRGHGVSPSPPSQQSGQLWTCAMTPHAGARFAGGRVHSTRRDHEREQARHASAGGPRPCLQRVGPSRRDDTSRAKILRNRQS